MRSAMVAGLTAGLLVATTGQLLAAGDEDLRMGDDPAYYERVEVPEAGIAVSFPPDWTVEIEMERGELTLDDPEAAPIQFSKILYATPGGGTWCDLAEYEYQPGTLEEHAAGLAASFIEQLGGETTAETSPVELPLAEAFRLDVHDPAAGSSTTVFLLDEDASRFVLTCMTHTPDGLDPGSVAQTLAWLPDEPVPAPEPSPAGTAAPDDGLQRVEVPEADVAISLPPDWDVEIRMEQQEFDLPPEHADAAPVYYTNVLYAESGSGDWCSLDIHHDNPLSLDDHAALLEAIYAAGLPEGQTVTGSLALIAEDLGRQVDLESDSSLDEARVYLFENGAARYDLTCASQVGDDRDWLSIADSVEALVDEPSHEPELEPDQTAAPSLDEQRIEVPEAGMALTLPALWTYEIVMQSDEYQLPADFGDGSTVSRTHVLTMKPPTAGLCMISTYQDMPMGIERHAQEHGATGTSSFSDSAPAVTRVQLPSGEAYRVDYQSMLGGLARAYLLHRWDPLPPRMLEQEW